MKPDDHISYLWEIRWKRENSFSKWVLLVEGVKSKCKNRYARPTDWATKNARRPHFLMWIQTVVSGLWNATNRRTRKTLLSAQCTPSLQKVSSYLGTNWWRQTAHNWFVIFSLCSQKKLFYDDVRITVTQKCSFRVKFPHSPISIKKKKYLVEKEDNIEGRSFWQHGSCWSFISSWVIWGKTYFSKV